MVLHKNFLTSVNSMPPRRRATSYATRAASRRRVAEYNPHPSHLTVHPAAGEVQQGTIGMNQPPAQVGRSVNTDCLENLGKDIAAAVQKSLQDAGISVTNPQTPSQPEIQFVPEARRPLTQTAIHKLEFRGPKSQWNQRYSR